MKRIVLTITGLLVAMVALLAQPPMPKNPEERALKHVDRLNEQLDLSDEQEKRVYELHLKYLKEREEIHQKLKESARSEEAELMDILTGEQKVKWSALKEERKDKRKRLRERRRR